VKTAEGVARVEIDAGELAMLLEGIDAPKVRRRKRYVLRENEHNDAGLRDPPC
jgi:hypothetical protein